MIGVVTFIVYLPALQNEFVWDDVDYVYENPIIRSLDTQLLKSAFFGFRSGNWHPLTWLSHAFDYAIWVLNPLGHHLTNNILHALNALMVVLLVMRLLEVYKKTTGNKGLGQSFLNDRTIGITGAATGLLFGLHPLHVESVAWVSERKDLLCAFFFLLSIITYTYYVSEIKETPPGNSASRVFNKKYLSVIGFFILSLLSKPMAVTLPFVLLILDWYLFGRIRSLKTFWTASIEKLPFLALTLISSILTILAQKTAGAISSVEAIPLASRALVAAKSLIAYLVKTLLPFNLVPFYPYPENISLSSLEYIIPVVIVVAITATCIALMPKQKLWISVWGYYVITLMPVVGIVQVGPQSMADRYAYLPSLGPFLILGLIAATVYERVTALKWWRVTLKTTGLVLAMAMLLSLSYATIEQIGVWKNSFVLWNYVIVREPSRVAFPHNNLGLAYESQGQLDKAIAEYQTALRLKPDYVEAHNNLGLAYKSQGQWDRAIAEYQTALRLRPGNSAAHLNLGVAYKSRGQLDKAIAEYQTALRLQPDYAEAHNNLGNAYESQGHLDKAIAEFQTAVRLKPDLVNAHYNLGGAYESQGHLDKAIAEYRAVLGLNPDDYETRQLLNDIASKQR